MPRVPTSQGPGVASQALPGTYQRSSVSPDLLGAAGRQTEQAGAALVSAGGELQKIHNDMVDQGNVLRVDEALNKATEIALRLQHDKKEGYTSQTGYAAVSRESGMPLAEEYTQKLDKQISDIAATLGNDRQKQLFAMRANNVVTGFRGHATAYETRQYQEYSLSVHEATVSNAMNALTLNYADPANVELQTTRIRSAITGEVDKATGVFVRGSAQMQGKSAAWAAEKADEAVSAAHTGAIKSALESGDANMAMAYFKHYGKDMVAKDVLAVRGTLEKEYDTRRAQVAATETVQAVVEKLAPTTDYVRAKQIRTELESGGRGDFNPDGSMVLGPVTRSGERAMGRNQVMPSTARDPGYGIKPADLTGTPKQQAAELARVGDQKFDVLVKMFEGDLPKVMAAYNAGEGTVKKALKDAAAGRGGSRNWLAYMPQETQKYVANFEARYKAGEGVPQKPTLAELHEQAVARLGPNPSSVAVRTARDSVTQLYTDQEKAVKQRAEEVTAEAMQAILKNGGSYAGLSPNLRAALERQAPGKVGEMMTFADRVAKGEDRTNPAVYYELSDTKKLMGYTDHQFFALQTELSESDFKHFANERNKARNGPASNAPGDLNSAAITSALDQRLRELGINPSPKSSDKEASAHVGTIRRFVDSKVAEAQRDAGKKFSDAETIAFIDRLAANSVELKGFWKDRGVPLLSVKPGDVPSEARDDIKAAFKKQGVSEPTDAQILNTYLHSRTAKNGR